MIKAVQVTEKLITGQRGGGGVRYYRPYAEDDRKDFKILWPHKEHFKTLELEAMIRAFGTGFIIVDENGRELRRVP